MTSKRIISAVMFICGVWGCAQVSQNSNQPIEDKTFAKGFEVDTLVNGFLLTIKQLKPGSTKSIRYLLYDSDYKERPELRYDFAIKTPVLSVVSNSTTHLALLEALGASGAVRGFAQTQYISSETIKQQVSNGVTREMGPDGKIDVEILMDINPDVTLISSSVAGEGKLSQLEELGIPLLYVSDYMERSLLGRAEWIKVMGLLLGKTEQANSYFDRLVVNYDSLLKIVPQNAPHPSVVSGNIYGSSWFMPGGQNYNATLIQQAGGNYLWADDNEAGWLTLAFEVVYERAWDADIWIGASNYEGLDDMAKADFRYTDFSSFKSGKVYTYTKRVNENGANDFFESGQVNPDRLLADHIKILHPELLPEYDLYYYKKLE